MIEVLRVDRTALKWLDGIVLSIERPLSILDGNYSAILKLKRISKRPIRISSGYRVKGKYYSLKNESW